MADRIKLGKAQVQGRRHEQQDAFGFNCQEDAGVLPRGGVVAVAADGVGGHTHGKGAGELAVRTFLQAYRSGPKHKTVPEALHYALHAANNAVCEFAKSHGEAGNCGTTLMAAAVQPETRHLHWISVGDSRLYLLRGKQWVQVTADSNYATYLRQRTVKEAEASAEEDGPEVELMALTSFLGKQELTVVDRSIRPFALEPDDWVVLCTDGLYSALSAEELVGCLRGVPQEACDALVAAVTAKGLATQDNATVAILAFHARELPAGQGLPKPQATPPDSPHATGKQPVPRKKRYRWLALAILAALAVALAIIVFLDAQKNREAPPLQAVPMPPGADKPMAEMAKPGKATVPSRRAAKP